MRFIVGKKIFDTEKAKLVVSYERQASYRGVPRKRELYKTQRGKWVELDVNNLICEEIKDEDVKTYF
ncbi:hypothetical protein [Clostridium perfringens]|uniref:hypothetical protein n=1 Tax=Clostridium perfringens TaxID=1502 RepID=UPI003B021AAB